MHKYQVYIEEVYIGYVEIEADSPEDAEQIARDKTRSGEINPPQDFDGNTFVEVNLEEIQNASI